MTEAFPETADPARMIVTERLVAAPVEKVWAAWTEPESLNKWFGPDGFRLTTRAFDFRVGGVWDFTMHGPDGTDYPNWVVFTAVDRHRRIAWRHSEAEHDTNVFVTSCDFIAEGAGTRLRLVAEFPSVEERERVVRDHGAVEGGVQTLGRLAALVEADAG
ncbi:uncharacterized protein YndB with AHSA1/START domain [Hoeflea marina]|uniref:Uncharacterized protein YndB with AHSA1/START domain n=1 Tax=Hoeflea marina TaxID=274592 RepID=A0A317PKS3_9HYPH|nr:SRPBCC domain-containing protein [Hoeflea marina]PWW01357.1 uncharacterized protein YndB with AHSA1/START domain [Hoeflea marina]